MIETYSKECIKPGWEGSTLNLAWIDLLTFFKPLRLEAEKFKSENDMKTFNETIRLIKIYFQVHYQFVDIK